MFFFSKTGITLVCVYMTILGAALFYAKTCGTDWCDIGGMGIILFGSFPGLIVAEFLPDVLFSTFSFLSYVGVGIGINIVLLYTVGLLLTKVVSHVGVKVDQ